MKVLVFDNYDSFTYNLVHLVENIRGMEVEVVKNDKLDLSYTDHYDAIILSPGPGLPSSAGLLLPLIRQAAGKCPILGVCLGHQAIAEAFGGSLLNLAEVYHGRATPVTILEKENVLFKGLPESIVVGRYHSWVVDSQNLPEDLRITAIDREGHIMALQHNRFDICSVQFHPESIMTPDGASMLKNWLIRP